MPDPVAPKPPTPCVFCGVAGHTWFQCPRVKAMDFHPNNANGTAWGSLARVEFLTPADNPLLQQTRVPPASPNWPSVR